MKIKGCKFDKDVNGFYLTPLVGFSKVKGEKSVWLGWLFWIFVVVFD
jgi:hypothetical protein